jgi:hypothetical protein
MGLQITLGWGPVVDDLAIVPALVGAIVGGTIVDLVTAFFVRDQRQHGALTA